MTDDDLIDARIKADAAIKLAMAALELVHNVTVKIGGGGVDFLDAARGFLSDDVVDDLTPDAFFREKASREYAAKVLRMLANKFEQN